MLTPWRKVMANLDSILKSRDITLLTKAHIVKDVVFPAVLYGCESWAIKKAEHQRIDASELWCWNRTRPSDWTELRMKWSEVSQSCPTLFDPMDCSIPGFTDHGFFEARVLEWVAISFSSGSSQPRDQTRASRVVGWRFTLWATRETQLLRIALPNRTSLALQK